MRARQHTVLVTGANKGIGREAARQLAARGWRVFIGSRNRAAGEEAAAAIGHGAEALQLDVSDEASVARAAEELRGRVDALDALVNNAGIFDESDQSVRNVSAAVVRRIFETNTLGPLRVTQAFLPLLEKSGAPRVINVSSGGGQLSSMSHWAPAYSVSKTALNAVTLQFAAALAAQKFAVNAVCPGWVRTDMGGSSAPRSVEQGADTIVWLASEAPQSLTGKFLRDREVIEW